MPATERERTKGTYFVWDYFAVWSGHAATLMDTTEERRNVQEATRSFLLKVPLSRAEEK
jgi:hypothetical protein